MCPEPRLRLLCVPAVALCGFFLALGQTAVAQQAARATAAAPNPATNPRPEQTLSGALRSHPATAPYAISATWRKGAIDLAGRVGTKQVHDVAVRLAIDLGVPFRDNLVIDTTEAHRVALGQYAGQAGYPAANQTYTQVYAPAPYIYPPPLLNRLDDPFFGFVPPLVSFPPWWQRAGTAAPMVEPRRVPDPGAPANSGMGDAAGRGRPNAGAGWQPFAIDPVKGQVDITVDAAGQVFLRGVVASEEARREIEDAARSVPGVTRVESQFEVRPRPAPDQVPPPPVPQPFPGAAARLADGMPAADLAAPRLARATAAPRAPAPLALDSDPLTRRVIDALSQRDGAADLPVRVRSSNGVVTLAGEVPSAYEAMLVYRSTQQTPGVHDIIDRLQFAVPDEDHTNPLLRQGKPDDVEAYLSSQVRRHIAEIAHLERLQISGNRIDLRVTLADPRNRDRVMAVLRSVPVLQGFDLEPTFSSR